MGNHNSKAKSLQYDPKEWEEVERSTFFEVMKNKKGQQANLYHFNIKSSRQIDEEVELYYKRRSSANWVQVIGANISKSGFGFCGTQQTACILTERIPVLLNGIGKLSKQDSLVVLFNSLRGFNDISRIIVPGSISDKMIGFTKEGQTKVWINENFGMNYPSNYNSETKLDEFQVITNLVNAVGPKTDLTPEFLNNLKASRSFNTALGFIRSNGGVPENVLQGNRIDLEGTLGTVSNQQVTQKDTSSVQNFTQQNFVAQKPITVSQGPQLYPYQPSWVPPTSAIQSNYRIPSVQFNHNQTTQSYGYGQTSSTLNRVYVPPVGQYSSLIK